MRLLLLIGVSGSRGLKSRRAKIGGVRSCLTTVLCFGEKVQRPGGALSCTWLLVGSGQAGLIFVARQMSASEHVRKAKIKSGADPTLRACGPQPFRLVPGPLLCCSRKHRVHHRSAQQRGGPDSGRMAQWDESCHHHQRPTHLSRPKLMRALQAHKAHSWSLGTEPGQENQQGTLSRQPAGRAEDGQPTMTGRLP